MLDRIKYLPGRLLTLTAVAGVIISTGGCAGNKVDAAAEKSSTPVKPDIGVISVMEYQQAAIAGKAFGEKLLSALKDNDFAAASQVPLGDASQQLTPKKFNQLSQKIQAQGGIAGFAYLGDLKLGKYRRLLWKVSFKPQKNQSDSDNADIIFELMIVKLNNSYRVAGFGFRP